MASLSKRDASSLLRARDFAGSLTTDIMTPLQCVSLGQCGYHPRVCGLPLPVADVLLREAPDTTPSGLRSAPHPLEPFGGQQLGAGPLGTWKNG